MKIETVKEIIKLLSKKQNSEKKERNSSHKAGSKYIRELGHKLNSETARDYEKYLAEYGYHLKGVAGRLDYKTKHTNRTELRAYNIVYAYIRNKPFIKIEKEFLGDMIGHNIHNVNSDSYSVFEERKFKQKLSIDSAKEILGLVEETPVYSPVTKKFMYMRTKVLENTDFDDWLRQS